MRTHSITIAGFAVGLAVSGAVLTAPAVGAAPMVPGDVAELVMTLRGAGHTVVVNRTGDQPLAECTVTGIRNGQTYSRFDTGYPGAQMDPMRQILGMTVYVDARC